MQEARGKDVLVVHGVGTQAKGREGGGGKEQKEKKKQALDNRVVKHKPTINSLDPMALQRRRLLEVPSPLPPDVVEDS